MKATAYALPAILLTAVPALAETTYMHGTAGYTNWSADGNSADMFSGAFDYEGMSGALTYGASIAASRFGEGGDSLTAEGASVVLGYDLSPNFTLLGSYSHSTFLLDEDADLNTYLIGGEYRMGSYTFGLSAARLEIGNQSNDLVQAFGEYDNGGYSAYLGVAHVAGGGSNTVFTLGFERETDTYEASLDLLHTDSFDVARVSGKYNLRSNFRLLANLDYWDIEGDNITNYGVGAGYMVANDTWVDLSVGRMEFGSQGITQVGLDVTFETGKRRLRTPERAFDFNKIFEGLPAIGS